MTQKRLRTTLVIYKSWIGDRLYVCIIWLSFHAHAKKEGLDWTSIEGRLRTICAILKHIIEFLRFLSHWWTGPTRGDEALTERVSWGCINENKNVCQQSRAHRDSIAIRHSNKKPKATLGVIIGIMNSDIAGYFVINVMLFNKSGCFAKCNFLFLCKLMGQYFCRWRNIFQVCSKHWN